ncbi:hypothetical protein [Paraflavitalea sp. CAU 1676]|uniref:hypothetical protein n=1 Tax=Paraflavitalea sp. CAU 1676 TaxID=3032598 RepID=UPI0023DCA69A|nr:hypothetical protein [Paraflavitalea sp. CAU 1676]MDF2193227.1 hypothetical protein [Paraflavitalea sp. CAU 1676]
MKAFKPFLISFQIIMVCACHQADDQPGNKEMAGAPAAAGPLIPAATTATITQHTTAPSTDEIVLAIRKEFQRINNSRLVRKTFEWESAGCGKGTLTYYLLNNEIVKTVEKGTADGFWTKETYYQKGNLIFQYLHEESHLITSSENEIVEYRTYVYQDKVIRYMADKDVLPCINCSYTKNAPEYKLLDAYHTGDIDAAICP